MIECEVKELDTSRESFDLILANPPYLPSDPGSQMLLMYGDGGLDGERVIEDIFQLLRFLL